MRENESDNIQYLIQVYPNKRFVSENQIELIKNDNDFWQNAWFEFRAAEIANSGWDRNERTILDKEANDYFQNAHQSNIIFEIVPSGTCNENIQGYLKLETVYS